MADILIDQEHCRSAGIECRIQFPAGSENHQQFILVTEFFIRNLTLQQEFAISEISLLRIIQQSDVFFKKSFWVKCIVKRCNMAIVPFYR